MLLQSIVVLLVILGMAVFWDVASGTFPSEWLGYFNWVVQGILLGLIGTNQVVSAVGSARESGILDFHRISPEEPRSVTWGFFLGAPIREYLLFLLTLPLTFLVMVCSDFPGRQVYAVDWLQSMIAVLLLSWLLQALGMLSALTSARAGKSWTGVQVFVVIVGLYLFGSIVPFLSRAVGNGRYEPWKIYYFGAEVPWAIGVALLAVPLTVFALIASIRKFRSERAPALSKPESLAFVTTAAVSLLGYFWGNSGTFLGLIYLLTLVGLFGVMPISPGGGDYARGVRRAVREGRRHLSFWDDLALGRVTIFLICLVVLIAATIGKSNLGIDPQIYWNGQVTSAEANGAPTIPVAVLSLASFGLAFQYFRLRAPNRASSLMGLAVFLIWVVPAILLGIVEATGISGPSSPALGAVLAGFTPITGLAAITTMAGPGRMYAQIAALIPALGLPFLLNALITKEHRRIDRVMRGAPVKKPPIDPLA